MKINKGILKIFVIVLLVLTIYLIVSNSVFAWELPTDEFENKQAVNAEKSVTNVVGAALNIVSTVGAAVAIIMLVVIGIEYVTQGAEGKAEAKKDLFGYIVGAVILFGSSGILKLLQMFVVKNIDDK